MFFMFPSTHGMKKILTVLLAFGAVSFSQQALATCRSLSTKADLDAAATYRDSARPSATVTALGQYLLSFPSTVDIDPDLPVNSVIATGPSNTNDIVFAVCDSTGGDLQLLMTDNTALGTNVYKTNIDGVGLRLRYQASRYFEQTDWTVAGSSSSPNQFILFTPAQSFTGELIKTGEIANNVTFSGGIVGHVADEGGTTVINISSNTVNIKVLPRCSVNSPNINIDFGTFGPRNVTATSGPSRPVNFNLTCTGPNIPTVATATLDGTPDPVNASLIKNNGTAQHLAIQLADVATGTVFSPKNLNSKLEQTIDKGTSQFALTTQVLRVGKSDPTAGTIDAIATITLNVE